MQLYNIQDIHFLNQISFNPLLLVSIEVFLLNLKFCCFRELPCSRNCFLSDGWSRGVGRKTGRQGQGHLLCFMDTSVPLCSISFSDHNNKTCLSFSSPQATFSKIPIGFIPLGQTSSLSQTLFAESGNKVQ